MPEYGNEKQVKQYVGLLGRRAPQLTLSEHFTIFSVFMCWIQDIGTGLKFSEGHFAGKRQ